MDGRNAGAARRRTSTQRRHHALTLAAALAAATPARAVTFTPIGSAQVSGGGSFFEGSPQWGGAAKLDLVPGIRFDENNSLLPRIAANYYGAQSARRVIDEGTLTTQEQSYLASLKYIHRPMPSQRFKLEAQARHEYLREVENEDWFEGLYDQRTYLVGVESERGHRNTRRFGLQLFSSTFPNYRSLSASAGEELMGDRILDTYNAAVYAGWDRSTDRKRLSLTVDLAAAKYRDQKLVNDDGSYKSDKRLDLSVGGSARLDGRLREEWVGLFSAAEDADAYYTLNLSALYRRSNQDHYDAEQLTFVDGYYDYVSLTAGPTLAMKMPRNMWVQVGYSLEFRGYLSRTIQSSDAGAYLDTKLSQWTHGVSASMSHPLAWPNTFVQASGGLVKSTSNMKYERLYRYNYTSTNFQLGFAYEF